jgi:hypothetical protein
MSKALNIDSEDVVRLLRCELGSCMLTKNINCLRTYSAYLCRSRRTKDRAGGSSGRFQATRFIEDQAPITLVSRGLASDSPCESRTLLLLDWIIESISTVGALRLVDDQCTDKWRSVRISAYFSLFDDTCSP